MNCPECKAKLTTVTDGSSYYLQPGKQKKDEEECPVAYYNTKENRLWYVLGHEPRSKEMILVEGELRENTPLYRPSEIVN